jgi:hypothetical protein
MLSLNDVFNLAEVSLLETIMKFQVRDEELLPSAKHRLRIPSNCP